MKSRLKFNFIVSAVFSMAVIFLFYKDELGRHLGNYFLTYSIIWVMSVVMLLCISFKLIGAPTVLKVIILGVAVGYLSSVIAHVFAVVLDVSNIRFAHMQISVDEFVIPLLTPFIVFKGWLFSVLFIPAALLLNRYSSNS